MATTRVIDVIRRVEDVLQDSGVRWPRVELQRWLNEAYYAVALVRPDATSKTSTFVCAEGTRQTLVGQYDTAFQLLDVTRNLAASSSQRVVRLVQRSVLDDQNPSWHAGAPSVDIQYWTFDPRTPKEFFVYPPARSTARLEVVYADTPGAHDLTEGQLDPDGAQADTILVDDIYLPSLIDWVLYRAYSKDAEYGANEARASEAYARFNAALGAKTQTDVAVSPATSN